MKAWMIKTRKGALLNWTLRDTKKECISNYSYTRVMRWTSLELDGYRCVRVTIKEDK